MPTFRWVSVPVPPAPADVAPDGMESDFDLPGPVVAFAPRREEPFTNFHAALVEVPVSPLTKGEVEELAAELEATESDELTTDEPPTCAGKDGECSRVVGEPGEVCWQHE